MKTWMLFFVVLLMISSGVRQATSVLLHVTADIIHHDN